MRVRRRVAATVLPSALAGVIVVSAALAGCGAGADGGAGGGVVQPVNGNPRPFAEGTVAPLVPRPEPPPRPARPALPGNGGISIGTAAISPGGTPSLDTATRRAPIGTAAPLTQRGPCLPLYGPGTPVPMTFRTVLTKLVAQWWHNADPATAAYWVGVQATGFVPASDPPPSWVTATGTASGVGTIRLRRKPIVWTRLVPRAGCHLEELPLPGVVAAQSYAVYLDVESRTPSVPGGLARVRLTEATNVHLGN